MPKFSEMLGTVIGHGYVMAKKAQAEAEAAPQIEAQNRAQAEAARTRKPVSDGFGTRWHPPGADGIPIASPDCY